MFASITLRYIGENLDSKSITSSLGVSPTKCGDTGDRVDLTNGTQRVLKTGFWEWSIKSDTDSLDQIDKQVAKFASVFGNVFDQLNLQKNCSHSWIDLHIIEENEYFPISFPLSNESISILNNTGLKLDVTIRN